MRVFIKAEDHVTKMNNDIVIDYELVPVAYNLLVKVICPTLVALDVFVVEMSVDYDPDRFSWG